MTEPRDEARDVLAAALRDRFHAVYPDGADFRSDADVLLVALAARGYRLVSEPAPDVDLERLHRIEAAARALDLRPDRAVTDGNAIAALRAALEADSR